VAHFGYLVAIPQVTHLFARLLAAFADAPTKRVVAVKPVSAFGGGDHSKLVTTVPAVVPLFGPKPRAQLAFADKPAHLVIVVVGIAALADPSLLPLGVFAVGQWQALTGVAKVRLPLTTSVGMLAEGFQHPATGIEPIALCLASIRVGCILQADST